jgi:hypothetical protein
MTNIRTQQPPPLAGMPKASFVPDSFNALIWDQGYNILLEEARKCPCRSLDSGSPLVNCQNCRGFGWVFINPIKTKAIISNVNRNTKYLEWSAENIGTIAASIANINRLAEYDRVTFIDVVSKRSEIIKVREVNGQNFVFLNYKPLEILDVFYLQDPILPLVKLVPDQDYSLSKTNDYILLLDFALPTGFNNTVSVAYMCNSTYLVVDIPHDLRAGTVMNSVGQLEKVDLPVNAILRKADIVLGMNDFDGGISTLDNSYL